MAYDTIIIGAGLSGLTSALLLARSGRRVVVLEQHAQPAPVVRGFQRDGVYFDSGFHYVGGLGEQGAMRPIFRHLGLADKLELYPFDARGFDRLKITGHDEVLALPVGFEQIRESLIERFPACDGAIARFIGEIEQTWWRYPYLDLDRDLSDFGPGSVHGESLAERLREFSSAPELQSLLSMHSLLYGVDPAEASTTLNAQVAGSYYHSVHGISGGGKALVDVLQALVTEAGGEILCRAEVTNILIDSGAVSGVRLATGEEISGREIIATLNPVSLPEMLPVGVLRPAYLKRLKQLRQTLSAYILFGRSRGCLDQLNRSNLFLTPRAGVFQAATDQSLSQRGCYLAAANGAGDDRGRGVIGIVPALFSEVAAYEVAAKQRTSAYKEKKIELAGQLKKIFVSGCSQLADLELLDLATPLTLQDYSAAPQGAIYGVGRYLGQYNPQPVTRLPGLFLSGQATAAPGLMGAVVAAYITCGSILGHELLRGEIKRCR